MSAADQKIDGEYVNFVCIHLTVIMRKGYIFNSKKNWKMYKDK